MLIAQSFKKDTSDPICSGRSTSDNGKGPTPQGLLMVKPIIVSEKFFGLTFRDFCSDLILFDQILNIFVRLGHFNGFAPFWYVLISWNSLSEANRLYDIQFFFLTDCTFGGMWHLRMNEWLYVPSNQIWCH